MDDDLLADLRGEVDETEGSVEDRSAILEVLAARRFDAIVTTAAHSVGRQGLMKSGDAESDRAMAVNVLGLRNVFDAALHAGVQRVVWMDSTVVYGPRNLYGEARVNEDDERRPVTFYGLTKVLGEDIAQYYRDRHDMEIVGLRLPLVLGPGLWYAGAAGLIVGMIEAASSKTGFDLDFHDEPIDLMHVEDVADAVVAALDPGRKPGAVYNINGFTARISDFIRELAIRRPSFCVTHRITPPAIAFPLVDDSRFRRETGFRPTRGISEIIDDMLATKDAPCTKAD